MPIARRLPTDVRKLVKRKWEGDADRIVQEKLQELQGISQGLPKLPITTRGDILVYTTGYDRIPVGANGLVLAADSTTSTGLSWINVGSSDQSVLACMIFGQ